MKNILILITTLIALTAFAGNGGGTMMTAKDALFNKVQGNMKPGQSHIIYSLGQKDGFVRYAHGQLHDGEWVVSEVFDSIDYVIENVDFVNALSESEAKQDWVKIK